jgi:hypothetical protein
MIENKQEFEEFGVEQDIPDLSCLPAHPEND